MPDFFIEGGLYFTGPLTVFGLAVVALTLRKATDVFGGDDLSPGERKRGLNAILQLGAFSFFFGILAQVLGLIQMLQVLVQVESIAPPLLYGGLEVSMIAPAYGLVIFLVSLAAWSILSNRLEALTAEEG